MERLIMPHSELEDDKLFTLSRTRLKTGSVIGVGHSLIHQMGNNSESDLFLSLHVYGDYDDRDCVTSDARLYDLHNERIQRINGGVFFNLKEDEIDLIEEGPKGDFPTKLRHNIEWIKRMKSMKLKGIDIDENFQTELINAIYNSSQIDEIFDYLHEMFDDNNHVLDSNRWNILRGELIEASKLQDQLNSNTSKDDAFQGYAEMYDGLSRHTLYESIHAKLPGFFQRKICS